MSDVFVPSIEQELSSGERLLWSGRPRGGIRFRGSDVFLVPFSLLWGGFAVFWEYMALVKIPKNDPVGWLFPLFGIPFVLMGLYIIFGRFWLDQKMREKTEYAVTNQRAIIVSTFFTKKIRSIDLKSAPEITLTEKADGSGTITFGAPQLIGWWMQRDLWFPAASRSAFELIDDARNVYTIIEKVKRS